jgi:hypothetical protein
MSDDAYKALRARNKAALQDDKTHEGPTEAEPADTPVGADEKTDLGKPALSPVKSDPGAALGCLPLK